MGSYKWGYKSHNLGYNYSYPTYNPPTTTHEPPSGGYRNSQWRKIDLKRVDFSQAKSWLLEDGTLGIKAPSCSLLGFRGPDVLLLTEVTHPGAWGAGEGKTCVSEFLTRAYGPDKLEGVPTWLAYPWCRGFSSMRREFHSYEVSGTCELGLATTS